MAILFNGKSLVPVNKERLQEENPEFYKDDVIKPQYERIIFYGAVHGKEIVRQDPSKMMDVDIRKTYIDRNVLRKRIKNLKKTIRDDRTFKATPSPVSDKGNQWVHS